jgi:hypothetical protein
MSDREIYEKAKAIFEDLQYEHRHNIRLWHTYQNKLDVINERLAIAYQLKSEGRV